MTLAVNIRLKTGSFEIGAAFRSGPGITALFGHSGAGKTTILKAIAGMVRPVSGRITCGGRVLFDSKAGIDVPTAARRTGFVFQDGRLFPHISVERNLRYAALAGRRAEPRRMEAVVDMLGLGEHMGRMPASLSGGERQRVAIGRALLSDPAILLMDEPLSSLDQARRQEILPFLEAVRDEARIPLVYVSHEIEEVARLADTMVVLSQGQVVAAGPATEVFGRLDLGPALGRHEASTLIDGRVARLDEQFGTALVEAEGTEIELVAPVLVPGDAVRMRIRARDIAIARDVPGLISVRNKLPVTIIEIMTDDGPFAELALAFGNQRLRARITRKSVAELDLKPGDRVHALLKAISLERRALIRHPPAKGESDTRWQADMN
ncbi:MAG: molybdenum ABC transporter ATP-binding protein [Notoacmeibacter sp.]|nr:molybdenum ABC transporter ATP-binding protein [Notoacmeibacter sp.]